MIFELTYGKVKIELENILIFLSNYLLNFLEYTKGHICHFFISVKTKINLFRGKKDKFICKNSNKKSRDFFFKGH